MGRGAGEQVLRQDGLDLVPPAAPGLRVRVGGEGFASYQLPQRCDGHHGDGDVAVRRPVNAVGRVDVAVGIVHGGPQGRLMAVVQPGGEHLELHIHHRFQHADVHVGALAAGGPLDQSGQDSLGQMLPGKEVRHR